MMIIRKQKDKSKIVAQIGKKSEAATGGVL